MVSYAEFQIYSQMARCNGVLGTHTLIGDFQCKALKAAHWLLIGESQVRVNYMPLIKKDTDIHTTCNRC